MRHVSFSWYNLFRKHIKINHLLFRKSGWYLTRDWASNSTRQAASNDMIDDDIKQPSLRKDTRQWSLGWNLVDKKSLQRDKKFVPFSQILEYQMDVQIYGQKLSRALRWCHNRRDSVSNHQPRDCLLNCLFRRRSKKRLKLRVTGLCAGNSPWTGEFHAQMASNAENVSIWWRHHGLDDAYMHQWTWSSLVQIMACCLSALRHYLNK